MTALAILSVASTPDAARGPATSDADADAFAKALTEAGGGAPSQPSRPTRSITRDNAIRGEEVAVRPETVNASEAAPSAITPFVTPPPVQPPTEGEGPSLEAAAETSALVVANADTNIAVASEASTAELASQIVKLVAADAGTNQTTDELAHPTPLATPSAEDTTAQAAAAASKATTDLALLITPGDTAPAATGLAPPAVSPREIIEPATRAGSQTEATLTDEAATDADGTSTQATGDKPATAPNPTTAPAQRPASVTPQPAIDVAALTAGTSGEQAETGGPSTSTAATTTDSQTVTTQDLTLSTLARATIETTAQLSAQIVRRLEGRYTRFELALTPEGLGRVDVSLDIDSDGQLAARLAFDNPAAAIDLRGRADELRRQLEDAGFRIASDGLDFAERDASSGRGFDRGQNQQGNRAFAGASRLAAMADDTVAVPSPWIKLNLTPRGVDMKV